MKGLLSKHRPTDRIAGVEAKKELLKLRATVSNTKNNSDIKMDANLQNKDKISS